MGALALNMNMLLNRQIIIRSGVDHQPLLQLAHLHIRHPAEAVLLAVPLHLTGTDWIHFAVFAGEYLFFGFCIWLLVVYSEAWVMSGLVVGPLLAWDQLILFKMIEILIAQVATSDVFSAARVGWDEHPAVFLEARKLCVLIHLPNIPKQVLNGIRCRTGEVFKYSSRLLVRPVLLKVNPYFLSVLMCSMRS